MTEQTVAYDPVIPWTPDLAGKKCEPVTDFGEHTVTLYERMKASMFYLEGQGIAAPQIGIFEQAALLYWADQITLVINPKILSMEGQENALEACLSLPGASSHFGLLRNHVRIPRATKIEVEFQDRFGAWVNKIYENHQARVFQHEFDHLSGIFITDRCGKMFRGVAMRNYQNWREGVVKGILSNGNTGRF